MSVSKNTGFELSYRASTGALVKSIFNELNKWINSSDHSSRGIFDEGICYRVDVTGLLSSRRAEETSYRSYTKK